MIDIRLKVFRSVALNLSFTKASQELFISQPAISKHIQELEKEFNTRLFERMGNRIMLTQAGQMMLEHTIKILNAYQKLSFDMNELYKNTEGELLIGASTTIAQYVMPKIIVEFKKSYPDVSISMLSGNTREVETAVTNGKIGLGMIEGFYKQPQLRYTTFMPDELTAIASCKGKFASINKITLEQLKHFPIVIREFGSGTLDVIQNALSKKGVRLSELNIEMNLGTTEGIKDYVEHSDCLGIVSTRSINRELLNHIFKVIEIDGLNIERSFSFVEKHGEASKLHCKFKEFITKGYSQ